MGPSEGVCCRRVFMAQGFRAKAAGEEEFLNFLSSFTPTENMAPASVSCCVLSMV